MHDWDWRVLAVLTFCRWATPVFHTLATETVVAVARCQVEVLLNPKQIILEKRFEK